MRRKKQESAQEAPDLVDLGAIIERARVLGEAEKWDEAWSALLPLARALPGAAELWLQAAQWQRLAGHTEQALATLREGIERAEGSMRAQAALWHGLAQHLFESQQWPEAALAAEAAIVLGREVGEEEPAPGEWARGGELRAERLREHELLEMLATARAHEGRFEEASDAMRALLALSPRDPLHRMRLASLLQSHGALGEAAREFERVQEMVPGTFFASDAESALDMLDKAQIQQILMRAGEEMDFGRRLERDLDATLLAHSFYLSESGRESLRQMIDDGRPDLGSAPRLH